MLLGLLGFGISFYSLYNKKASFDRLFYLMWSLQFIIVLIGVFFGFRLYLLYISIFLTTTLILLIKKYSLGKISNLPCLLISLINFFLIVRMLSNYFCWPFALEQKLTLFSLIILSIFFLLINKNYNYNKPWYYLIIITYLLNAL